MIYCLNLHCGDRVNPETYKFCQSCGSQLLLRNRYRVVKFLGGGGFGRTYLAVDQDCMNAPCVVKQFSPSLDIQSQPAALQKATEMFYQEAVRLWQLGEHPQIPRLLAYFEQEKYLYLVQEFIDGQDLKQELALKGAFSEQKIRQLLADMLPVLKFIHAQGVIHRDIKPGNIMRRRQDGKLMLIDFGVSKQATGTFLGKGGTTVGTAGFTPLEQMRGQAYPASDLYSLGVTCVCLLTQHLPKQDGSDEVYDSMEGRWMWREYLPQDTTVSQELGQVLDKLLQDLPKHRYQSAAEVMRSLSPAHKLSNSSSTLAPTPVSLPVESLPTTRQEQQHSTETTTTPLLTVGQPLDAALPEPLVSAVGIDYTKLRQLLVAKQWKEADFETTALLLRVSHREQEGWMRAEDFKTFPCQDLQTIDQLWVTYSEGRFGFSVQRQVWENVGARHGIDYTTWCRFGDRLGWRVQGNWLNYSDLTFNPDTAPPGHLPAGGLDGTILGKWDLVSCSIALRLVECNIQ